VGGLMETIMKQGIDPELIDLRSMVPYDKECIAESVKKTGRLLIVHEAPVRGGFGGEIAAFVSDECFSDLKAPVKRVGSAEFPLPFGNPDRFVLPKAEDVMAAIAEIMKY
jgi:pyruvate/2-oxoglutarate/acetoin dehydrogenase E1 component